MVAKCGGFWIVSVESIGESIAAPAADRVLVSIVAESSGLALISSEFGVFVYSNLPVEILDHKSQASLRSLASTRDGNDDTFVTSFFPVTVIFLTNALLNVAVLIVSIVEASHVRINVALENSTDVILLDGGFAVEAESTVSDSWVRIDSFSFSGVRFSVRSSVASIPASVIVVRVGSVVVVIVVVIVVVVIIVVVLVFLVLLLLFLVSEFIDVLVEVIFVGVVGPCDRI